MILHCEGLTSYFEKQKKKKPVQIQALFTIHSCYMGLVSLRLGIWFLELHFYKKKSI